MAVTTFEVKAPAPGVQFHLLELSGREELGRPFYYDVTLLADKGDVKAEDVLGKSLTVTVHRLVGTSTIPRYYNGLISRFSYKGTDGDYHYYSLTIRPWLWFLSRATDCRIFQNLKVDKILEKVFTAKSFTDHSFRLNRTYRQWEYCCQYRESDFDFVSRMLEQEGIYYLFEHLDGSHRVKFVDDVASLVLQEGNSGELYFREVEGEIGTSTDFVDEWERAYEVTSGGYVLRDYDFEKPKETLESRSIAAKPHAQGKLERYDYPGEYKLVTEGEGYAKARLEELQWPYKPVRGRSNSSGMGAGLKFKLLDHPASTENQEYFVVANDVYIKSGELEMTSGRTRTRFEMRFQALESKIPYRTPRTTPRPIIAGPQTAVVVGSKGEEIWTDKYGRVKVQFPWDREGKFDENSSCWIRVSQLWAGKNWGGIHVPRVGQEVVVEFLEGDPDRPLITGRVYNAEQPVPYTLPANATQSGIKSRTSKEGTAQNFNELRFEDKKDSEEIYFHAEKDFNRVVENNDTLKVGFEKSKNGDQSIEIFNNQSVKIGEGKVKAADGSQKIVVFNSRSLKVGDAAAKESNETIEIFNNQILKVGNPAAKDGSQTIEIWKDRTETVKTGNEKITIELGNRDVKINTGNDTLTVAKGNLTIDVSMGKAKISAMQAIDLICGGSSIKMTPAGITLKSTMIKIQGTAMVDVKSLFTQVKGDAMLVLKGGVVMIN